MQILFIILGVIGLAMTFFGVKWTLKSFRAKTIEIFPLIELRKEFEIIRPGLFSICIIGGGHVNNTGSFQVSVQHKDNKKTIDLKENYMKPRFHKKWKTGVEYFSLKIENCGIYKVEISNPEDLIVKQSINKSQHVFQSPLPIENIEISIKETVTISKQLFGIIFLTLGVNMSIWGIMLGINPELFG
jgi:hypothetical protein